MKLYELSVVLPLISLVQAVTIQEVPICAVSGETTIPEAVLIVLANLFSELDSGPDNMSGH